MLQMKIKTGRRSVVPGDLPSILGARRAYRELGDMVEALIAQMDMLAGDCDMEPDDIDQSIDDWGESADGYDLPPIYGIDQSRPFLNEQEIVRGGSAVNDRILRMKYECARDRREIDLLDPSTFTAGACAEMARRRRTAA